MDRCILKRRVLQIQPNKAASLRHVWRAAFEIGQALSTGYDAFDFETIANFSDAGSS